MAQELEGQRIVLPGGGSGPISIVNGVIKKGGFPVGITCITDDGGDTRNVRSMLGVSPPGDASQQLAARIFEPQIRQLLTFRFAENGERAGNRLLAAAEKIAGSHSKGVKLIEKAFRAYYTGRVIPVSDDKVHLRIHLAKNGHNEQTFIIGERHLDEMYKENPAILRVDYVRAKADEDGSHQPVIPTPNREALKFIRKADAIVIPPGSWWGSIEATLEVPGVSKAIGQSSGKLIWICNACDYLGWKPVDYLKRLTDKFGRPIDSVLINTPDHDLPETYAGVNSQFVDSTEEAIEECRPFSKKIYAQPFSKVYLINDKPTIRHRGRRTAHFIAKALAS